MSTLTLSLAEPTSEWLSQRVASGEWPSREAYVSDLIARDREEAERFDTLKAAIDEGLASGVSDRTVDEIFAAARERHLRKDWADTARNLVGEAPLNW